MRLQLTRAGLRFGLLLVLVVAGLGVAAFGQTPGSPCDVQITRALAAESARQPGTAIVRIEGRVSGASCRYTDVRWGLEYGPTSSYGTLVDPTVTFATDSEFRVVADVDGLPYDAVSHYRLFVLLADGSIRDSGDAAVQVRPVALRPPQRVQLEVPKRPTPAGTLIGRLIMLDAPRGAQIVVRQCSADLCRTIKEQAAGRTTVLRNRRIAAPDRLEVEIVRAGLGTVSTIAPRRHDVPRITTKCGELRRTCLEISMVSNGPKVRRFGVKGVLDNSTVRVVCRGPGCPRGEFSRTIHAPGSAPYGQFTAPGYTRLRPGASLRVYITRPGSYGSFIAFRVTKRTIMRSSLRCLALDSGTRIIPCPSEAPATLTRG